ncbi:MULTISPECIES: hypothetical protein [Bacillaceae]|jgi:hypothetical protein|uniref:hypothetical protein n=1 Tax=Bacillaceae TaxID=186817 RepID=UPI0017815216|nr:MULTISPECIES: hypothetical protein [Bacillaceae]MBT2681984.1 hypothetical protein [Bacillus sp. ISL-35]MBT2706268.1 hypothetical protein [Chryseobacterium sp. ISL-80]MCM3576147.1 hypothetical protein [Mesobacillus subterraneus]UYZ19999.1 hypothetical protein FOF60_12940 [Mesobacillus jeotgali]
MKKRKLITLSLIGVIAIIGTTFFLTKPNESDFVMWMEQTYDVNCLDYNCDAFKLKVIEHGENKVITMQVVSGGYSPGTFLMNRELKYRNYENSSYVLDIDVIGILGKISLVNETKRLTID